MKRRTKECGAMDSRFKKLDTELNFEPNKAHTKAFFDNLEAYALDNAFIEASQKMQYPYVPAFWNNFTQQEGDLIQSVNFSEAAINYNTAYHPIYWNAAQEALASEGLHYQYKASYWNEAEKLLVAADRKVFFAKWLSIASALLVVGLVGHFTFSEKAINVKQSIVNSKAQENENIFKNAGQSSVLSFEKQDLNTAENTKTIQPFVDNSTDKKIISSPDSNTSNNLTKNTSKGLTEEIPKNNLPTNTQVNAKIDLTEDALANAHETNRVENLELTTNPKLNLMTSLGSAPLNEKSISINNKTIAVEIRSKNPEIQKINLAESIVLSEARRTIVEPTPLPIERSKDQLNHKFEVFLAAQTGIGNTFSNSAGYNQRTSADFGIAYNFKKLNGLQISLTSGFDYQTLNNYTDSYSFVNYERTGKISHQSFGYEFNSLVKWQNSILFGYKVKPKITLRLGGAIDRYFTSQIKIHETKFEEVTESPFLWGQNDFINQYDIQLITQLEYKAFKKISIVATGKFGFLNQIN